MKRFAGVLALVAVSIISASSLTAAATTVRFENGLLSVTCNQAPLAEVLEEVRRTAGIELILEDEVKSRLLSANIVSEPVHFALQRLLTGAGVNYALFFDPQDWERVSKIFVGAGGGALASASPAMSPARGPRRISPNPPSDFEPEPAEEDPYYDEAMDPSMDPSMMPGMDPSMNPGMDEAMQDENAEAAGPPEQFEPFGETPEGAGQDPGFVPRPPTFPRSRFTPGLESSPFGTSPQNPFATQPNQPDDPNQPPQPMYPFLDPFGRPIPVPPDQLPPGQDENNSNDSPPQ